MRIPAFSKAIRDIGSVGSPYEEELLVRDMDLDVITQVRQTWQFYRDRRPDQYEDLVRP